MVSLQYFVYSVTPLSVRDTKTSPFTLVVWNRLEGGGGGCLVSVSIAVSQKGDNDAGERGSLNDHATFANSLV